MTFIWPLKVIKTLFTYFNHQITSITSLDCNMILIQSFIYEGSYCTVLWGTLGDKIILNVSDRNCINESFVAVIPNLPILLFLPVPVYLLIPFQSFLPVPPILHVFLVLLVLCSSYYSVPLDPPCPPKPTKTSWYIIWKLCCTYYSLANLC